jgi:uroporphyrinogen decarboxylase
MFLDIIAGLRQAKDDDVCVTGRIGAPFSAVTLIFGMAQTYMMMHDDPELVREAMRFTEDLCLTIGMAQIEAGAHALWLGDCNASTHLMSPRQFEDWALEPCKRVTQAFKDAGAFVFLHNSEEQIAGLKAQALTEPSVLSAGPGIDMAQVREALPNIAVMGNVDPIGLLQLGSASQVAGETDRLVRMAASGGMIINSGECVPRDAKGPNLHTMIDTAKKIWNLAHARG